MGEKCILRYPGAKNRLAPWIMNFIPPHDVYVEPFAGSLAVLFNKERCHIETVNNLDSEIVNFFRVLREHPQELREAVSLTPYAREEYESARDIPENLSDIERARRFAVRCYMGYGSSNRNKNGFKNGQQTRSPNPADVWAKYPDRLAVAADRLKGVQIEHLPALELMDRYDTSDVFFYIDPPYPKDIRVDKYLYKYEMTDAEHEEMLAKILSLPERFLISSYRNELYDRMLDGWHIAEHITQTESGHAKTEALYYNYDMPQQIRLPF